jgi:uncharacterized membrane protein HdeD (DUF308 family)
VTAVFGAQHLRRGISAPLAVLAGVLAMVVGAFLIFVPRQTAEVLIFLLALVVVVKSVAMIADAGRQEDAMWAWRAVAGIVGLVVGLIVLAEPVASALITVVVAYYVLAVGLVIGGLMELVGGLRAPRSWITAIIGALEVVLAVLIMFFPATGAELMLQFTGALVMVLGVVLLASLRGSER